MSTPTTNKSEAFRSTQRFSSPLVESVRVVCESLMVPSIADQSQGGGLFHTASCVLFRASVPRVTCCLLIRATHEEFPAALVPAAFLAVMLPNSRAL